MKNFNIIKIAIVGWTILFAMSSASAEGRVRAFEMGESGHTLEFPMTPAEIAAEDAANAGLKAASRTNIIKSKQKIKIFEMGESGYVVSFPMTAKEIKASNTADAKLAAAREASAKLKRIVDAFELAESGVTIEFPVMAREPAADDSGIAGGIFDNEDLRI